jgi:RNA polymerase sigma-70 factor (ECF subfamily)
MAVTAGAGALPRERDVGRPEPLVAAALAGDRTAFAGLYARYVRLVHGILLSRIPPGEVEDLVQDVFLTALQQLGTLRDPAAFGGWIGAIARNRATDYLRRAPKTIELSDKNGGSGGAAGDAHFVLAQIRSLPEAYRETLTLRLVEGMTGSEIAARTGLTEGSVRVNLHRGMKQLRERLERGAR